MFQSIEDIGKILAELRAEIAEIKALVKARPPAKARLIDYGANPHHSEIIAKVEAVLEQATVPMYAYAIYEKLAKQKFTLKSVNPGNYLSTLMARDRARTGSRLVLTRDGWAIKKRIAGSPMIQTPAEQYDLGFNKAVGITVDENGNEY